MSKKNISLLVIITLIGLFLRFYKLGETPAGLTWDEAGIGYNAYSLIKTGRDEHGIFAPWTFKSFGDYKPGVYIWLTTIPVAIFGLSEFSTRFISALIGTLTIPLFFWWVFLLFEKRKLALICAFVLALSPWHIFYSRGAWEVNLMTFWLLAMMTCLSLIFKSSKNNKYLLAISLLFGFLALSSYQAGKLLVPLILGLYFVLNVKKSINLVKRTNLLTIVVLSLYVLTLGMNIFASDGNRLTRLSIFGYRPEVLVENQGIDKDDQLSNIIHNRWDFTARLVGARFLKHISTDFLFYEGDKYTDRGHISRMGMMNMFSFFLMYAGAAILYTKYREQRILILGLLVLSIIPGSLTLAEFSSTRNLFMVIPLSLLVSVSFYEIVLYKRWIAITVTMVWLFGFLYFADLYFIHSKVTFFKEYNEGYKVIFEKMRELNPKKAVITDIYGQPYIYYLFYFKYDPAKYQSLNAFESGGIDVGKVFRVGDVEFHQFTHQDIELSTDTFFAGTVGNIRDDFNSASPIVVYSDEVKFDQSQVMFRVIKTK